MKATFGDDMPHLYGLVLAGGRSIRMGQDKAFIEYHGIPQVYHTKSLLELYCPQVYVSCRADQQTDPRFQTLGPQLIPDAFGDSGPLGAIASAFNAHPEAAWLILACDLPLLGRGTLKYLIDSRDSLLYATAFSSEFDGRIEPLCAIWEPKMAPLIQARLQADQISPRDCLEAVAIYVLGLPDSHELDNVNQPAEREQVSQFLQSIKPELRAGPD